MNKTHVFPCMQDKGKWIGIAFKTGDWYDPYEAVIMGSTVGQYVHCELVIGDNEKADVYSSYDSKQLCCGFARSIEDYTPKRWTLLTHKLADTQNAKKQVLQILDKNLPYNKSDLWQCCIKTMLPFESELDCELVDTWKHSGVFCSQMCLLFLRHMARVGDLTTNPHLKHHLESVHSRGCSPNLLFGILSPFFTTVVN